MTAGWRPVWRLVRRQVVADPTRTLLVVGLVALAAATLVLTTRLAWARSVGPLLLGLAAVVELSALAIGDRDRLQTMALLDVVGARPRIQAMVIVLHGCMLGVLGTVVGVAGGVALRYVLSLVDPGPVQARLGIVDVLAVVFAGLFTSFGAAVVAGLGARRTSIRAGLSGRRPSSPPRWRGLLVGLSLVACGTLLAGLSRTWSDMFLLVPVGGLLFMAGSVMIAVLTLGRIDVATRRPGRVWHQAGLGLARQRYRTGAVVAVLTAALGASTVGAVFGRSFGEREHRRQELIARYLTPSPLPPGLVRIDAGVTSADRDPVTQVQRILPRARRLELRVLGLKGHELRAEANRSLNGLSDDVPREVVVGDKQLLQAMGLGGLGDELAAGRAIVLVPFFVDRSHAAGPASQADHGYVTLAGDGIEPIRLPAVSARRGSSRLPAVVISAAVARRLGLDTVARVTLFDKGRPFTSTEEAALHDPNQVTDFTLFEASKITIGGDPPDRFRHDLASGPFIQTNQHAQRAIVVTIGGLGLLTIIAVLTLVSLDRRRDDQLLVVLGADHRYLRKLGALQAWLLATVAAVVASPLALAGTAAGFAMYNRRSRGTLPPIPFVLPVDAIAVFVVVLPLVAAAGTWLLTADVDRVDLPRLAD